MREQVQHLQAVLFTSHRGDRLAEDDLLFSIVPRGVELEFSELLRIVNRPPRERPRNRDDVGLRVTAVDAEGMELHQLAAVVLVQAWTLDSAGHWNVIARRLRLPVVEIEEHRR